VTIRHRVRRARRKLRHALRFSDWPLRQKIGVGVWIPVALFFFLAFTGPNRGSAHSVTGGGAAVVVTVPSGLRNTVVTAPSDAAILQSALLASVPHSSSSETVAKILRQRQATEHGIRNASVAIMKQLHPKPIDGAALLRRQRSTAASRITAIAAKQRLLRP
jgi:hypothetical protein